MFSKRWLPVGVAALTVSFGVGVLAAPGSASSTSHSCGSAAGFERVTAAGVSCRYATRTFIPTFTRTGKVLPRGWKCAYTRGAAISASCRRQSATITWKLRSKGVRPTTREYRVYADLELDLPMGTQYSVNPVGNGYEKCVNDRQHGTFTTTRKDETITLWMDASEQVINPACITLVSYIEWDFVVKSDPTGSHLIYLGQGVNGGPYKTQCEDWYRNKGLRCAATKQLGLKISR